ncbi:glycosyltransferase family 2 protein [Chryseosolibacter indicus]|uniref:Glycosyltransferase family 2 protein n=1 Tax=Chryseosolibacter indicus TaxID=2782351 RepID=A0ABS5VJN6_9BACT|nr:glycosyltransferase family 2 protein [Chryseosolibacter indicus]MBT1701653.1 glycosyltransferase family 2 protein [Chryseosolibacter indicus]
MKISGFTMVRNAAKLYYPIRAAIESILPICDEFVVALGEGDADDTTEEEIKKINSDKVKIIRTVWDLNKYPKGMVHAYQTDIAKQACTGDWLFYVQSDEVVHEQYLPVIKKRCEELLDDKEVEGLLFNYKHFWGDYNHYIVSHAWYPREIRIVRNLPEIHSWWSAQSFRRIPNFDGLNYRQKKGTYKLRVASVDAFIYHYGWVRPPQYMQIKRKAFTTIHKGKAKAEDLFQNQEELFNYGDLSKVEYFNGSHPSVLKEWMSKFNWQEQLYPIRSVEGVKHKHERLRYRLLTFIEQKFLQGRLIGGFKNYKLLKR